MASAVPALDDAFDDDRADLSGAELAGRALVVIPLGTMLVEELAFVGVMLALARRVVSPVGGAVLTAGLFGLWQVLPAWRADGAGVALGTLVFTTGAGFAFGWLRTRGSCGPRSSRTSTAMPAAGRPRPPSSCSNRATRPPDTAGRPLLLQESAAREAGGVATVERVGVPPSHDELRDDAAQLWQTVALSPCSIRYSSGAGTVVGTSAGDA